MGRKESNQTNNLPHPQLEKEGSGFLSFLDWKNIQDNEIKIPATTPQPTFTKMCCGPLNMVKRHATCSIKHSQFTPSHHSWTGLFIFIQIEGSNSLSTSSVMGKNISLDKFLFNKCVAGHQRSLELHNASPTYLKTPLDLPHKLYIILSHDVTVIQWITSCHK